MEPDQVRWAKTHKPALGGLSFYINFLASFLVYLFFVEGEQDHTSQSIQIGIFSAVTVGFFAGLADDAFNTVPWLKLSTQIICGLLLVVFNIVLPLTDIFLLDAILTVLWTIAVMNSINMLDNMDGITSIVSISILVCAAISAQFWNFSELFFTLICGGTVAALVGFLWLNWHPSKIYMGDTGSQMLGALLSGVGILFFWSDTSVVVHDMWWTKLALVFTAFVIPIGDSLTVSINRIRRGQSPMVGGRDHTTHHLSYAGLTDRQVALVMILISAISILSFIGFQVVQSENLTLLLGLVFAISTGIILFLYSTTQWKKTKARFKESL